MLNNCFKNVDPNSINSLSLAFIGDCVYEMFVRSYILSEFGNITKGKLHDECVKMARSSFQAKSVNYLKNLLTDEELQILKRGRNSGSSNTPKNSNVIEYRLATGLESLFGFLYLNGQIERLKQIFLLICDNVERGD